MVDVNHRPASTRLFRIGVILPLIYILLGGGWVSGQESVRELMPEMARSGRDGMISKYLTPGMIDRWLFEGAKGEILVVYVTTNEFDPTLELARETETEDEVLVSVDDDGSESRFSFELPEDGKYKIRVRGYENRGGGNYSISVRRFNAESIEPRQTIHGRYNNDNSAWFKFEGQPGQHFTIDLIGSQSRGAVVLDPKGNVVEAWNRYYRLTEPGVHYVQCKGTQRSGFQLAMHPAVLEPFAFEQSYELQLKPKRAHVLELHGAPRQLRLIKVEKSVQVDTTFVHIPDDDSKGEGLDRSGQKRSPPVIQQLPIARKQALVQYAVVLGRSERYHLRLFSELGGDAKVTMTDPRQPIDFGQQTTGQLEIGGAGFFGFQAKPAQLIIATVRTDDFDPVLRLYDAEGNLLAENNDGLDGFNSRISQIIPSDGEYLLQAACLGDGGRGSYQISLQTRDARPLELDQLATGQVEGDGTDFWALDLDRPASLVADVRSKRFDTILTVRDKQGNVVATDDNSGAGTNSLMALDELKPGRYTFWISGRGSGDYEMRLFFIK